MKRSVRISEGDIDGYNFFHRALIAAGWLEISQTRYIEFEFAKPDEIIIMPPPEPAPEPEPPPEPVEGPPAPIEPPPPPKTVPDKTNQQMIQAFYAIANQFDTNGWALILAAGLSGMAASPEVRAAKYRGPALEDLPISPAELRALVAALGLLS